MAGLTERGSPVRTTQRWLSIGLTLLLLFPLVVASLEDSFWQRINSEGRQLRKEGRFDEAEKISLLALAEAERFGAEDYRVAATLNELAALYHSRGRLDDAEPLYRRALDIWEKFPDRLELATALSNLARLCLDQQKYGEVEQLSERALNISESLSPQNPEVANSLNNLADVHALHGRYAAAEPLYRRALKILENSFGPDHFEVAYGLTRLGKLAFLQARFVEAEAIQLRAIAILQKGPGQNSSTLATSLNSLADLVAYQGRKHLSLNGYMSRRNQFGNDWWALSIRTSQHASITEPGFAASKGALPTLNCSIEGPW